MKRLALFLLTLLSLGLTVPALPVHAFVDEHTEIHLRYSTADRAFANPTTTGETITVVSMFRGNAACTNVAVTDDVANVYTVIVPCTNNGGATGMTEMAWTAKALTTGTVNWVVHGVVPPVNHQNFAQIITYCATANGVNCSVGASGVGAISYGTGLTRSLVTTYSNSIIYGGAHDNTGGASFTAPSWDTFGDMDCDTTDCWNAGLDHAGPGTGQPNRPIGQTEARTWTAAGSCCGVSFLMEIRDPAGKPVSGFSAGINQASVFIGVAMIVLIIAIVKGNFKNKPDTIDRVILPAILTLGVLFIILQAVAALIT